MDFDELERNIRASQRIDIVKEECYKLIDILRQIKQIMRLLEE